MKKIIIYSLLGILVIVVGVIVISCSSNPLRKSEARIRESILDLTPIGMSMDDIIKMVESKEEWEPPRVNYEYGVLYDKRMRRFRYGNYIEALSENFDITGEKSIDITMGHYSGFLVEVYVTAWWAFDEDSKLIDVFVYKERTGF